MKYLIIDIVLMVAVVILTVAIGYEFMSKRVLREEIIGLTSQEGHQTVSLEKSSPVIVEAQTISNESKDDLKPEIAKQKEISRVLAAAEKDLATLEAMKGINSSRGWHGVHISNGDCREYWRKVSEQADFAKQKFQRERDFVEMFPLEQLEQDDQEFIKSFLDLKKEWSEIAYDSEIASERKVAVYSALDKDNYRFYNLMEGLFNDNYPTERLDEYTNMLSKLTNAILVQGMDIVATQHLIFNGQTYKIRVPEEPYFDPEEE